MATSKTRKIVAHEMEETMSEFKHHELTSGSSGKIVTNPNQAIAIGLSEARKAGANIPSARAKTTKQKKT